MDLAGGQVLELLQAELLRQRVDARVLEELVARVVDLGQRGVRLQLARVGELAREVLARVEELEEAADGFGVIVGELDLAGLVGLVSGWTFLELWMVGWNLRFRHWRTRRRPRRRMDFG